MMPLIWFKDSAKSRDELHIERLNQLIGNINTQQEELSPYQEQLNKPIETVKERKTISLWWFVIDILLLLSGYFIPFFLLSIWLIYRASKLHPANQLNNISAQPAEHALSINKKYGIVSAYRARYTSTPKVPRYTFAEIDEMDGYEFEKCIKHIYENLGYSVHHTQLSGDQGADLILTSKEGIRTAIQVKRYSSKVSNGAVQEVVAAKGLYKCTEGMVVTNSYFTDSAKQLARANNIELIDRNGLEKLINKISQNAFQDKEWLQHFHSSSSSLNTYFTTMITDLKNLDYITLKNFDQEVKKAMEENSQYSTSPIFLDARNEWGEALISFQAMKVHTISNDQDITSEVIENLKAHILLGFGHLNRANEVIKYLQGEIDYARRPQEINPILELSAKN